MRFIIYLFIFSGLITALTGCKKDKHEEASIIKIYDDQDGNKRFFPLAIAESVTDDGYLLLNAFDGWKIQLTKVDKNGDFLWNTELPEQFVNAVPKLINFNNELYFVCMDQVGLFAYIMQVDETSHSASIFADFQDIIYPTFAYSNDQNLFIQNYNRTSYTTEIHRISPDLSSIEKSGSVNIFTSVEERIVDHVAYTGQRIPFFVATTPDQNHVIMNGFYNYSFSLLFLNNDLEFEGVYNGSGLDNGFCALLPTENSLFSVARFSNGNLFFNPGAQLNPTSIDIAASVNAQGHSELNAEKPVIIRALSVNDTKYNAFLSSTHSNQLVIFFYGSAGNLAGKKYIGKNVPIAVYDALQTTDGGLLLLVQVKIMGSFDRIATIKLTKEQLENSIH